MEKAKTSVTQPNDLELRNVWLKGRAASMQIIISDEIADLIVSKTCSNDAMERMLIYFDAQRMLRGSSITAEKAAELLENTSIDFELKK